MLPMGELCAYRKVFHYPSTVEEAPTKNLPGRGSQRKEKITREREKTKQNKTKETKKNEASTTKATTTKD